MRGPTRVIVLSNIKILTTQNDSNVICPLQMRYPKLWEPETTHLVTMSMGHLFGTVADGRLIF
jgi:hypothetical protein